METQEDSPAPGPVGSDRLRWLPTLAIEVASIVIGVLLALGANQWNETRKNENQAREALTYVAGEVQANQEVLEMVHAINVQMLHYLETAPANSDSTVDFVPGLQIRNDAWSALVSTGKSAHVDYALLLTISEVYSYQRIYREFGMQLTEAHVAATLRTAAAGRAIDDDRITRQMQPYIALITSIEGKLLEEYATVLEDLAALGVRPPSGP